MQSLIMQPSTRRPLRSGTVPLLLVLTFAGGCGDTHPVAPVAPAPSPTPTELVVVSIVTTGTNPDSGEYMVSLVNPHGETDTLVHANSSVSFANVSFSENHLVQLTGIAPNCTADGSTKPVYAKLPENGPVVAIAFTVSCVGYSIPPNAVGTRLAFVRQGQIYSTTLGSPSVTALTNGEEPAWSPDGKRIAFVRSGNVYVMDEDGANERLVATGSPDSGTIHYNDRLAPAWSPDGSRLALYSDSTIVIIAVDSIVVPKHLVGPTPRLTGSPTWSPDAKHIVFTSDYYTWEGWDPWDITLQVLVGDVDAGGLNISNHKSLLHDNNTLQPAWSPDGGSIAVVTCGGYNAATACDESHISVMNPDGSHTHNLVNSRGLSRPAWSPDGTTIAYANTCRDYNCPSAILYVSTDGTQNGILINDAHSPSWHR